MTSLDVGYSAVTGSASNPCLEVPPGDPVRRAESRGPLSGSAGFALGYRKRMIRDETGR